MAAPRPIKRKHPAPTDGFASRKRAFAACQFCRLRKTRCDNVKPICGYCRMHDATCVYDDHAGGDDLPPKEPEDLTKQIMDRFDVLERLIKSSATSRSGDDLDSAAQVPTDGTSLGSQLRSSTKNCVVDHQDLWLDSRRCESILAWPIFSAIVPLDAHGIKSLITFTQQQNRLNGRLSHTSFDLPRKRARGYSEDAIVTLIRKFIEDVLPRNPVIDGPELLSIANEVAEHGVDWSPRSCLIVSTSS